MRQGVMFECLELLHSEGVFKTAFVDSDRMLDAVPLLRRKSQQQQSNADLLALVATAGGAGDSSSDVDEVECWDIYRGGRISTPTLVSERVLSERRHSLRVLLVDDNSASQQAWQILHATSSNAF